MRNGDALSGTFTASGTSFAFEATLVDDTRILESGGATYPLARQNASAYSLSVR